MISNLITLSFILLGWLNISLCLAEESNALNESVNQPGETVLINTLQEQIEEYNYVAKEESTGKLFSAATHRFTTLESGEVDMQACWEFSETATKGTDKSRLTKEYSTKNAHVVVEAEESDYTVERIGAVVEITGLFRGKRISKRITIDNFPFYTNPTIGLKGFLLSGKEKSNFWLLRPDKPEILRMKAMRLDSRFIEANKRQLEIVGVKWGPAGFRALFFSEVYWFGTRDFIFLKNIRKDGILTELIY